MRSLTEQVTFKISPETLAELQRRARVQGLDANPYARKLVEEGLNRNRTENLADEFRELLGVLRPIADRLASASTDINIRPTGGTLSDHLDHLTRNLQEAAERLRDQSAKLTAANLPQTESLTLLAHQLVELRADLNKTFAALLHFKMDFSVEEAQHWVDARLSR